MQGYVSMEIQRIVWKPHCVSRGYTKDFVKGRQLAQSMKNRQGLNYVPLGASELAELLNYHYTLDLFKKKLRRITTQKRMFSYETEDQPLDDPKETYKDQCFNLVLGQTIYSIE